jgi:hypothetical protein
VVPKPTSCVVARKILEEGNSGSKVFLTQGNYAACASFLHVDRTFLQNVVEIKSWKGSAKISC